MHDISVIVNASPSLFFSCAWGSRAGVLHLLDLGTTVIAVSFPSQKLLTQELVLWL